LLAVSNSFLTFLCWRYLNGDGDGGLQVKFIRRRSFGAIVFFSVARTSLSPCDAILVKRAQMLVLSHQGRRLRIGMRRTRHAYLIQKPNLCRFVIVTAAKRYRIALE